MRNYLITLSLLILAALTSCEKIVYEQTYSPEIEHNTTTYKVAVIQPLSNKVTETHLKRTAQWFLQNFNGAQRESTERINLEIDWIDEDSLDDNSLEELASKLATDNEHHFIIGPYSSDHADIVAQKLSDTAKMKMMISPTATSAELHRKYAGKKFFWALVESDITQCEILLTKAQSYGATKVALLASNSTYGQTFIDWFAFQAGEMGMTVSGLYKPEETDAALHSGADYLICVPDKREEISGILEKSTRITDGSAPKLLFSDTGFDLELTSQGSLPDNVEGITPYADPSTGFELAYKTKFSETPSFMEVQLYDALMLSALTLYYYNLWKVAGETTENVKEDLFNIMCMLLTREENNIQLPKYTMWDELGLYAGINYADIFDMVGASGALDFDLNKQSSVLNTTYSHWMVYHDKFLPIDYLSTKGSKYTGSTVIAWEWKATAIQEIPNIEFNGNYAPLESQWAVLVCGSRGWFNYRHQSDVLNVYQLLRKNGFSDDHIILIASPEAVANDSRNLYKGEIRGVLGTDAPNLWEACELDYCTDSLDAKDICDILAGIKSEHLPKVVESDNQSNVLFYWSGHGQNGKFEWSSDIINSFTTGMLQNTIEEMSNNKRFRKMLICGEPCYSGSVLKAVDGFPGVLAIASAKTDETSFSEFYDTNMNIWLSDRFTNHLVSEIANRKDITFRELYRDLVNDSYGSHVTLFNYPQFDNLYISGPKEFFYNQIPSPLVTN